MRTPRIKAPTAPRSDSEPLSAADGSFVPLAALQNAIRFWWFLALMVIFGGLVGFLIHLSRPPIYEATAQFSASIDYVATGPMTQFEEDTALNAVNDLLYSDQVAQMVADQLKTEGLSEDVASLKQSAVMERRVNVFVLRVRAADPQRAGQIASAWLKQGQVVLQDSYQHALAADRLNRYLLSLENCLTQSVETEPVSVPCSPARFAEIQSDMSQAGKALAEERQASHELFSGLTIGPTDGPAVNSRPVIFGRNQVVMAGALIGFLVGVWLIQLGLPARLWKRS